VLSNPASIEHVKVDEVPVTQERLGLLLARHGQFVNTQIRNAMATTGLTPRHRQVLVDLSERGPTSQQSLLETLSVDPSVLVSILNDLEQQGLAERRRDPADRRRHIVEMSSKGCDVLRAMEQAVSRAEAELFADLDDVDRDRLHELLTRVRTIPDDPACDQTC
jgi:DNA-binding MarR family transcriptional regulator